MTSKIVVASEIRAGDMVHLHHVTGVTKTTEIVRVRLENGSEAKFKPTTRVEVVTR